MSQYDRCQPTVAHRPGAAGCAANLRQDFQGERIINVLFTGFLLEGIKCDEDEVCQ